MHILPPYEYSPRYHERVKARKERQRIARLKAILAGLSLFTVILVAMLVYLALT